MPEAVEIGFVGCRFMGRARAHPLRTIDHLAWLPKRIRLVSIAGRRPEGAARSATQLGFEDLNPLHVFFVEDEQRVLAVFETIGRAHV